MRNNLVDDGPYGPISGFRAMSVSLIRSSKSCFTNHCQVSCSFTARLSPSKLKTNRMVILNWTTIFLKANGPLSARGCKTRFVLTSLLRRRRVILDDNYRHALQILKDENSGGIRLQASVLRGHMKRSVCTSACILATKWNGLTPTLDHPYGPRSSTTE